MKRIAIMIIVSMLTALVSQAQVRFDVGLKGGLNFSDLKLNSSVYNVGDYGSRTGYHLGAYALFKIAKIGIQPEIVYSKQGHSFSYSGQPNLSSNFDYVNVPIIVKWYIGAGFNLQLGPQFGFLTSAKGDVINGTTTTGTVSTGQDIKNFVNKSDFSVGVGFGWDLPLGINITARYNKGFTDANKTPSSSSTVTSMGTSEAKNQVIQLSLGYRLFKIGK